MGEHGFEYWGIASTLNDEGCDKVAEPEFDIINKARHYNRDGAIECIEEMELIYGKEALMWFCLLSQHKYRYRAGLKDNGYQDLEKSDYYMRKYRELKEELEGKKNPDKFDSMFKPVELTFTANVENMKDSH